MSSTQNTPDFPAAFTESRITAIETIAMLLHVQEQLGYARDILTQQLVAVEEAMVKLKDGGVEV